MKRMTLIFLCTALCAFANEETSSLQEPFIAMTKAEQKATGIAKLNADEQVALVKWMKEYKEQPAPNSASPKEVTISEILDGGKIMVFSDGTKLTFDSSARKKLKNWAVGDKIGLGAPGRRGGLSIYHISTGIKVKGFREQAPTTAVAAKK